MRKRNGFTLVELLATIVILGVILTITITTVIGNMRKTKEKSLEIVGTTIHEYLESNYKNCKLNKYSSVDYDTAIFDDKCNIRNNITEKELSDTLIANSGYSQKDLKNIKVNGYEGKYKIEIEPNNNGKFSSIDKYETGELPKPNKPNLLPGLVPIKYKEKDEWEITTSDNSDWYNYDKQQWANAVVLKPDSTKDVGDSITLTDNDILAAFVWIPRFSYTIGCTDINNDGSINTEVTTTKVTTECLGYKVKEASDLSVKTPGAIDIRFVSTSTTDDPGLSNGTYPTYTYTKDATTGLPTADRTPSNWYTHPAFNFGGKQLSGIWVGKYETSGTEEEPTIIYGGNSLTGETITPGASFSISQKFTATNNIYGLSGDAHMTKNSEWAAVAYLSQSVYGKYGNSDYKESDKVVYINDYFYDNKFKTGVTSGSENAKKFVEFKSDYNLSYDSKKATGASTTGNVYGVYDMAGGAAEYVMGFYGEDKGYASTLHFLGFNRDWSLNKNNEKYYNRLSFYGDNRTKSIETVGQSMYEVYDWYGSGHLGFSSDGLIWITRGANHNLIYSTSRLTNIMGLFVARSTGVTLKDTISDPDTLESITLYPYSFRVALVS